MAEFASLCGLTSLSDRWIDYKIRRTNLSFLGEGLAYIAFRSRLIGSSASELLVFSMIEISQCLECCVGYGNSL